MNKYLLLAAFTFSLSAHAADNFVQTVKDVFMNNTRVDYTDWYTKGDTAFAEFDGMYLTVYQHLKAAVNEREIDIKMEFTKGAKRPESEEFMQASTILCQQIFGNIILPKQMPQKVSSWDEESEKDNELSFMDAANLQKVGNETQRKIVNGWDVSIRRSVLLTSCSARKI